MAPTMRGCVPVDVDYTQPCPGELAMLAVRYRKSSGGFQQRTWKPSTARVRACRVIVYRRDHFTCQAPGCGVRILPPDVAEYAGAFIYGLEVDHVKPYRDGGLFIPANLQTLCVPCNNKKGSTA